MKTIDLTIWDVPLRITLWKHEKDQFDPQSGHYTVPDKWRIETIEHAGVDISEIVSDEVWQRIEREANNG